MHTIFQYAILLFFLDAFWIFFMKEFFVIFLGNIVVVGGILLAGYAKNDLMASVKVILPPHSKKSFLGSEFIGSMDGREARFELVYIAFNPTIYFSIEFMGNIKSVKKKQVPSDCFFRRFWGKTYFCRYDFFMKGYNLNLNTFFAECLAECKRLESLSYKN